MRPAAALESTAVEATSASARRSAEGDAEVRMLAEGGGEELLGRVGERVSCVAALLREWK